MEEAPLLGVKGREAQFLVPFLPNMNRIPTFSFRGNHDEIGTINICPSSLRDAARGQIYNDVSFEQNTELIDLDDILGKIPAIQIREYAQDSRIVQIQNALRSFSAGWDAVKDTQLNAKFWKSLGQFVKLLPQKIAKEFQKITAWSNGVDGNIISGGVRKAFEFDIPFLLYYQICTTQNNGFYTIPYSGKIVDASNGSEGWNTQHGFNGVKTSEESFLGTMINFIGKNIKFNTTPVWDGNTSHDFPSIEVQFDLFNDSLTSSISNFLFLTSIMSKNRFIQYHIFQHNPCVYDIKIEGYNRLYMCSGNMQCEYKGVSRQPTEKFFKEIEKHKGRMFNLDAETMIERKMIRIPDIYSFKLTFQSLLPNSMNNYLFRFSGNDNMDEITARPPNMTEPVAKATEAASKAASDESGLSESLGIKTENNKQEQPVNPDVPEDFKSDGQ